MTNYFDKDGNYINAENLSLAEIYKRAAQEGYKKGYMDASLAMTRATSGKDISKMTDDLYAKLMGGGV